MSFEQYQFMRYYLPGSLFLVYLALLLAPFGGPNLAQFMQQEFGGLVTLALGAFVLSPVIGYIIYALYDTRIYNKKFMDWERRPSLQCLVRWAMQNGDLPRVDDTSSCDTLDSILRNRENQEELRPATKGVIDFIIHSEAKGKNSISSGEASRNLISYWSNFAARHICSRIVLLYSLILFVLIIFFDNWLVPVFVLKSGPWQGVMFPVATFNLYTQLPWLIFDLFVIFATSVLLWRGEKNPRQEAFQLEYYIIRTKLASVAGNYDPYKEAGSYFKQEITETLAENLRELLSDISSRAKLEKMPELIVRRGAFAHSALNKIYIGRRILSPLTDKEKEGVIAHEVYHTKHFKKSYIYASIVPIAYIAITSIIYIGLVYGYQVLLSSIPPSTFSIFLFISAVFVSIGWGRFLCGKCELSADRFAASMVGARVFRETLRSLKPIQFEHGRLSRLKEWFCPHPPLDKRLNAITGIRRLPLQGQAG